MSIGRHYMYNDDLWTLTAFPNQHTALVDRRFDILRAIRDDRLYARDKCGDHGILLIILFI